ncbi:MAG: aspartate aminotransferase family protein [Candidatus Eisenbacteria bacterium]|uniref:Aspartate aminotransferase family protein n=1 Tax=Eiseniibacteriota bacterium TaxID=2212470 RepID=A0A538T1H8_UNCEI|nr:MAG: aspartate aminotransferase family protein [Candidatus Eisenbacteria bacterium]
MSARERLDGTELPRIVVPPPGPRSRAAARRLRRREGAAIWGAGENPIVWSRGRGAVVVDLDGNRYVDLTAGFGVLSLGQAAPEVARAVSAQSRKLTQGLGDLMPHEAREKLVRRLAALGGRVLDRVLLASTGAEAVELALKTAHVATGRRRVVSFTGAYHGQSYGALAVTDTPGLGAPFAGQIADLAIRVPFPYEYRCPLARRCDRCDLRCLDSAFEIVDRELHGPDPPGAVLVEPVQGRSGCVLPPPDFLPRLRARTRERGLILILDEVMTGAGRTGPFWAWERGGDSAAPDLLVAGKGIGGGVAIAALLGRDEVMESWRKHVLPSGEAPHSSTFYGHPLACAGALRAIDRLAAPETRAHVERAGALFATGLRSLHERCPAVGDVRAAGLMAAIELVRDRESREPAPRLTATVVGALLREGVLAYPGGVHDNVICFTPPLTITEEQLGHAVGAIGRAIQMSCGMYPMGDWK